MVRHLDAPFARIKHGEPIIAADIASDPRFNAKTQLQLALPAPCYDGNRAGGMITAGADVGTCAFAGSGLAQSPL